MFLNSNLETSNSILMGLTFVTAQDVTAVTRVIRTRILKIKILITYRP